MAVRLESGLGLYVADDVAAKSKASAQHTANATTNTDARVAANADTNVCAALAAKADTSGCEKEGG